MLRAARRPRKVRMVQSVDMPLFYYNRYVLICIVSAFVYFVLSVCSFNIFIILPNCYVITASHNETRHHVYLQKNNNDNFRDKCKLFFINIVGKKRMFMCVHQVPHFHSMIYENGWVQTQARVHAHVQAHESKHGIGTRTLL